MDGLWEYVYEGGKWFWQLPVVAILLGICEGGLFLWFTKPLEERFDSPFLRFAEKLLFLGLCILLQFRHMQIVMHCLCFLFLWTAYILLTRCSNWKNALFISSVFCLITELAKLLIKDGLLASILILLLPGLGSGIYNGFLLVFYLLVLGVGVFLMRTRILRYNRRDMTAAQMVSLVFPLVLYLFVRNLQFLYMGGDNYLWIQLQFIQIACAICALFIIVTTEHVLAVERERNELMKMEMLLREQQQQYLVRKETIDAVNRKYHDLKHYLTGIQSLSSQDNQDYVQTILREIEPYERCQETGCEILDILLTDRIRECQEKQIRLIPFADGRQLNFISTLDLCAIFGNAMDNAMEAVDKLSDEDLREISVKIGVTDGLAILRFHNYFDGTVRREGGRLLTRKTKDEENHGYGLENIRRLAEKYGGTAACEIEGQEFSLNVMIPLPADSA